MKKQKYITRTIARTIADVRVLSGFDGTPTIYNAQIDVTGAENDDEMLLMARKAWTKDGHDGTVVDVFAHFEKEAKYRIPYDIFLKYAEEIRDDEVTDE